MTKREYYDLLVKSCDDGTFPSGDRDGCHYRAPGGKKCAVGVLIPDDVWRSWHESAKYLNNLSVYDLDNRLKQCGVFFDFNKVVDGLTMADLRSVQNAHDKATVESLRLGVTFKMEFLDRLHALPFFKEYAGCTS